MKFLCDVHISIIFVKFLVSENHNCIHVNTILDKWFTADSEIAKYANTNDLILITKDSDFRNGYYLNKNPKKLIKINLGNISNSDLIEIIKENLPKIEKVSQNENFLIEVDSDGLTYSTLNV